MVVLTILLVPTLVFAAGVNKFGAAKATCNEDNLVVVPLEITNQDNLAAVVIPLEFSEGVTMKGVDFTDTRVEYFDLKTSNIDNENNTVLIGLLPQMTPEHKPKLTAGTGTVARLIFEVNDPAVSEVTLKATTFEKPYHELSFVYVDEGESGQPVIRLEKPEFLDQGVSLTAAGDVADKPYSFALSQNYPNPFNPTTVISYSLPVAGHVNLTVYNVLGQTVSTLVDGYREAGPQTEEWNASDHSSGVYFYRITTTSNTETKKMMLLK